MVCARGPKLPARFSFDHTDAGLPRGDDQLVEGGVEGRLEVTEAGAGGPSILVQQRRTNVRRFEASAL